PAIAHDMIAWDGVMGPWVADVRSGSVAKLPQQYGGLFARDSALLVVAPTSRQRQLGLPYASVLPTPPGFRRCQAAPAIGRIRPKCHEESRQESPSDRRR